MPTIDQESLKCIVCDVSGHGLLSAIIAVQMLTVDVGKLKCIVRLADMMLCGSAMELLMEGVRGLQARLPAQAPLLVEPDFRPQGVQFQPEGQHMLKVSH